MSLWLTQLGANVTGFALEPNTNPNFYQLVGLENDVDSNIGDIRDAKVLHAALEACQPDIVFHLAAQPLVRLSYDEPLATFDTNAMGTAHLLEACRSVESVKSVVIVTTDKCYENKEWHWGYRENEPLGGYDPYSASKACAEIVTGAYRSSFPNAIRPWQHVLEPVAGYLILAERLFANDGASVANAWNFGPNDEGCQSVGQIVKKMQALWGDGASFSITDNPQPHEARFLKLDCSRAKDLLNWHPVWNLDQTLETIVHWYRAFERKDDLRAVALNTIQSYENTSTENSISL